MKPYLALPFIVLVLSSYSHGQDTGRMRYSVALRVADLDFTDIGGVKSQSVCFSARNRLPGVSPKDIRITLETKTGAISLPLDADGIFTLPVTDALRNENPWISTNQPKGSMIMKASVNVRMRISPEQHAGKWRVAYVSLFPIHEVLRRADSVADAISRSHEVKSSFPTPVSVTLSSDKELATARLVMEGDVRDIPSTREGEFVVPFKPELTDGDVWIVVDPPQGWSVTPVFESATSTKGQAEQSD